MDMDGARLGLPTYKSTTRDVRRLLEEFNTKNVDAVVIDLRWNGGGSLTEAVNMTGLFIDNGPVVQVKGPDGRIAPVQGPGSRHGLEGPAGGDDQQVQRQRQRDLRRRDSGLRPRHRHRRPRDARQGHGAAAVRPGQRAVPHRRQARTSAR